MFSIRQTCQFGGKYSEEVLGAVNPILSWSAAGLCPSLAVPRDSIPNSSGGWMPQAMATAQHIPNGKSQHIPESAGKSSSRSITIPVVVGTGKLRHG